MVFLHFPPISIHALRVEGDEEIKDDPRVRILFLSTPSGWRATSTFCDIALKLNISIHALRVEGDTTAIAVLALKEISIHALRVEGDQKPVSFTLVYEDFYPRPPGGGRHRDQITGVFNRN